MQRALRHLAGGIAGLRAFLEDHAEAVEVDLRVYYHGVDLRDLWRPGGGQSQLTWRLLGSLIRHLPPESATKTALRNAMPDTQVKDMSQAADPARGQWSQAEMLLALLVDAVRNLTYTTVRLQAGGKAGKPPQPVPRPGVKPRTPRKKPLNAEQRELLFRRIRGEDITGQVIGREAQPAVIRSVPASPSP